jgi:hypothetical protein
MPWGFEWMLKILLKPEIKIMEDTKFPLINKITQEYLPFIKGSLITVISKNELQSGIFQGGLLFPLLLN